MHQRVTAIVMLIAVSVLGTAQVAAADGVGTRRTVLTRRTIVEQTVEFVTLQDQQEAQQVTDYLESTAYLQSQAYLKARAAAQAVVHQKASQSVSSAPVGDSVWDRMAQCETGGNWQMRGSSFSGGVGFANTTWNAFGGQQFASNAGLATREQQIVVAERVRAAVGFRAWGCAKRIGVG